MTWWNLQVVLLSSSETWSYSVNQSHKLHQTLGSRTTKIVLSGVILETEGSIWKIQNRALLKLKTAPLIWHPPIFVAYLQFFW